MLNTKHLTPNIGREGPLVLMTPRGVAFRRGEIIMEDMPKLKSPFIREIINGEYVVTPQIEPGYEWVFEDPNVLAVEKLDGTNVSIQMECGNLIGVRNRTNIIDSSNLARNRFMEGVRNCYEKKYIPIVSGQHFGELMGPKIQGNFLKLDEFMWFPFEYLQKNFSYRSFHQYPKTFENLSSWFKNDLFSLVYSRFHNGEKVKPEGIVFTHPDGRMAKLRVDMFDWYTGKRHRR